MEAQPLISVLMPTHNGETFVAEAMKSVLSQHGVELELVITDDGSADSTPRIVRAMARRDSRIRFAVQPHAGAAAARNRCLARAHGSHIALLDQDDRWPAGKLARQLARLGTARELAAVFGLTRMFGETIGVGAKEAASPRYTMLLSAGLLRREAMEAVGEFDPRCGTADDLDFLLRMLEAGHRIELESELGVLHRRHAGQASADRAVIRRDCVRALARSLARRREAGIAGPLHHPLLSAPA